MLDAKLGGGPGVGVECGPELLGEIARDHPPEQPPAFRAEAWITHTLAPSPLLEELVSDAHRRDCARTRDAIAAIKSVDGRLVPGIRSVRLTAAISRDGDWYVARCLEVEVTSQGTTVDEARTNLAEALALYFEDESSDDLPEPPIITQVDAPA